MKVEELQAAARELPHHEPDPAQRDAMRAALLEAARACPPLRPRRAAPALAVTATAVTLLSAAGLMLWWSSRPQPQSSPRATIQSSSGAHFEHTRQVVARESAPAVVEEVVRLREGRVAVAVDHLTDGERFRVLTSDAEVEVRGTAFDVLVEGDRLVEVAVSSGRVDVRPRGRSAVSLAAGERWRADAGVVVKAAESAPTRARAEPPTAAPPAPTTAPVPAPTVPASVPARAVDTAPAPTTAPAPARTSAAPARTTRAAPVPPPASRAGTAPARTPARTAPTPAPVPRTTAPADLSSTRDDTPMPTPTPELVTPRPMPTASETAFGHGFRALRQGNYGEASAQFELAIRDAPATPLAADARYWRAVSLARSGTRRGARAALADFLARHPTHARAGEASAMLGWMLLDAGDPAAAATRFRAALRDPDREVRASAERGMARIGAPR